MKIKKSNMSYFAPSPKPVLSRCLFVLAVNDFGRALFFNPTHRATDGSALTEQHTLPPLE